MLTGVLIAQTIQGIQSSGVIACAKHYIGNEQEHFRQGPEAAGFGFTISDSLSSNIDDVTLHELYLWYNSNEYLGHTVMLIFSGHSRTLSEPVLAPSCVVINKSTTATPAKTVT